MVHTMEAPFGIVDMGSNGIRFSIVSALKRHMPVIFEERAPISLLIGQDDQGNLSEDIMTSVVYSFLRFKQICHDAGVCNDNVHVIATEATRIAANRDEFCHRIHDNTGWNVTILSKQEEALTSAAGIVGSNFNVQGLTMDLGGGSVELSYIITRQTQTSSSAPKICPHPVSLPYGAAVLKKSLDRCETDQERQELYQTLVNDIQKAFDTCNAPESLNNDGYTIYLSGGGFRALGYLSMAATAQNSLTPEKQAASSYPIPIINGYSILGDELKRLIDHYKDVDASWLATNLSVFRISKRRASMIPASCFLLSAILQVIPIKHVTFSEGGVRQGFCFQNLAPAEQDRDPLLSGVEAYVAQCSGTLPEAESEAVLAIVKKAMPDVYLSTDHPMQLYRLLPVAILLSNLTSHYPKESRAFVSLHLPIASGPLANVPGINHRERAILALTLAFRQGGNIADPFLYRLQGLVGHKGVAVCKFIGRLLELIFTVSPIHPGLGFHQSGLDLSCDVEQAEVQEESEEQGQDPFYPPSCLHIRLPKEKSPILEAPVTREAIDELNKVVNAKKRDLDMHQQPLNCPRLFNIRVSSTSPQ